MTMQNRNSPACFDEQTSFVALHNTWSTTHLMSTTFKRQTHKKSTREFSSTRVVLRKQSSIALPKRIWAMTLTETRDDL